MRKALLIITFLAAISSCRLYDRLFKGDVVARAGRDVLYESDVEALNITGFSAEDSARIVERYIMSWAKNRLLLDMAESQLSKADRDVEAQLEEYRQQLLVYRYEQKYVEQRLDTVVSEQEYLDFYEANPASFTTHVPLMKGRYIKMSDNSPNLNPVKSLYRSRIEEDMDRLEQLCYTSAEKYYFFEDWEGLDAVVEGTGLDVQELARVLENRSYLEKDFLGYTYLISVDDYVPAGSLSPYEYCRERIRNHILNRRKQALVTSLERNLLNDAIVSEKFVIYTR